MLINGINDNFLNVTICYHLVMTNILPWKDPPMFKFGEPSISIRAIEKPWRTVNVITRPGKFSLHTIKITIKITIRIY